MMKITVNGKDVPFEGLTLADLIDAYRLDRSTVVAERNGEIVHREDTASTALAEGDIIELVRLVGGG